MADIDKPITRNEAISELTAMWYDLVSMDHHKDRDCHWTISKRWSYNYPISYSVEHYGYVWKEIDKSFDSAPAAERFLIHTLCQGVERETKHWLTENQDEYIELTPEQKERFTRFQARAKELKAIANE